VPPAAATGESSQASAFGRVDDDGTVYVRTDDGERAVGSYPGATPGEALTYFARKYDEVVAQVELFEQRLAGSDLPVGEIDSTLARLRRVVRDLRAVGDLPALAARVEALTPIADQRRRQADAARQAARAQAQTRREGLVEEAERLAALPPEKVQWRTEGHRMKELFETWRAEQISAGQKATPGGGQGTGAGEGGTVGDSPGRGARLDRRTEEELWKRFSHARTAFDRKRRQHFAHLDEQYAQARVAKERLVDEAESLRGSTDWAATSSAFKRLMDRWRSAGRAARRDDDVLWQRFKTAQDAFFAARSAVLAEQDQELAANLVVKEGLLREAESLLPVTDLGVARSGLRAVQERWETAGKVPRADVDRIERRMRAVEQEVRGAEDSRWRNDNPEARARARSAVDQLEGGIADLRDQLRRATDQGKAARVRELQAALEAREEWLIQARRALTDFGG
jgi:hypothetical protein